jgi:hypothetical protein
MDLGSDRAGQLAADRRWSWPTWPHRRLGEIIDQAHKGIERVRRTPHQAYSFLRRSGLSVS